MAASVSQTISELFGQARFAEAEQFCRRVLHESPTHIAALEALVASLAEQKKWRDVGMYLPKLLELNPYSLPGLAAKGHWLMNNRQFVEAEAVFRQIMGNSPGHPIVLADIASALSRQNKLPEAAEAYERAAYTHPQPQMCWRNRAIVLRRMGRLEEAMAEIEKAMKVEPNSAGMLSVYADILCDMGRLEEAEPILRVVMAQDPQSGYGSHSRLYLTKGDFAAGYRDYAKFIALNPHLYRTDVPGKEWAGESLKDKAILLYEEQGYGDTFQNIRYAEMLEDRGATVYIDVRTPMKQLISRVRGVSWTITIGEQRPPYDYRCSIVNIPRWMGTTLKNIPAKVPYITPPSRLVDYWRDRTASDTGKLRVGLCWFGRQSHEEDYRRSMDSSELLPLKDLTDVSFYSLQRAAPADQLKKIAEPLRLIDHTDRLNDFADTAALMANLDLVISVDTSIVHLAGAMGRPVWTLLCRSGEWRWMLEREDTPWYPTMRLIRQKDKSGWGPVIERVRDEIAKLPRTR